MISETVRPFVTGAASVEKGSSRHSPRGSRMAVVGQKRAAPTCRSKTVVSGTCWLKGKHRKLLTSSVSSRVLELGGLQIEVGGLKFEVQQTSN